MKAQKQRCLSLKEKMLIAVVAGFAVGILCLFIKGQISSNVWDVVDAIFFQDITATESIKGIGIFYIIGQLFMHGLQMMIVPLVLCSLSLALCSLAADPKKLGKIAGKTFICYICFYVVAAALAGAAAYFVKSMGWLKCQPTGKGSSGSCNNEGL